MTLLPATSGTAAAVQALVPLADPLAPLAAFAQVTAATPTLSDADPPTATEADDVLQLPPVAGDVIATLGAALSIRTSVLCVASMLFTLSVDAKRTYVWH